MADFLARKTKVFCLDEFFVTDVADATILNRLFGHLWDCGTVLVATSNRAPKKLYEGGLQRDLFMPFIARLEVRPGSFSVTLLDYGVMHAATS